MSNIKKNSDNTKLIHAEKTISKSEKINTNLLSQENSDKHVLDDSKNFIDSKQVVLNTIINITVELGRTKIKIKDFLGFSQGSMLILDKLIKEPLDIFINDHLFASGEIVVLEKKYGIRITRIKNALKNINILS